MPTTLAGHLDVTYTDGFLVLKDGAIAYERYFNGMHQRTLHLSQSVAKSFTGIVAGILIERRILDVNVPVTQYLPELEKTGWRGATLQQVLDMTTAHVTKNLPILADMGNRMCFTLKPFT